MTADLILSTRLFEDRSEDPGRVLRAGVDLGFTDFHVRLSRRSRVREEDLSPNGAPVRLRVRAVERLESSDGSHSAADRAASLSSVTSTDRPREQAIADVVALGDTASLLHTDLLVLSLGAIDWEGAGSREEIALSKAFLETTPSDAVRAELVTLDRDTRLRSEGAADRACRSIHEILKRLPERRLALRGAERPTDLASPERLKWILDDFRGRPVHYWHDVGHAERMRFLGLVEPGEWLDRLGSRLLGVTLADAAGARAHLVPGDGTADFRLLREYVTDRALRVLELAPGSNARDVAAARRYLEKVGLA